VLTRLAAWLGRRDVTVAATVVVVLALSAWTMIGFYADRPAALPRAGKPMPVLANVAASSELEAELIRLITALARRNADAALLVEAVYYTPELLALQSRSEADLQGNGDAESLLEDNLREHDLDRYLVFTLVLSQDRPGLGDYRPAEMIRLRTDDGRTVQAVSWLEVPELMSDSSRVGMLHFPRFTADSRPLLTEDAGWFELVLSGLGERDEILRWEWPIAHPLT
jgi:hypothetical protein